MRGHQLREVLTSISRALGASGAKKHAEALDKAQTALSRFDDAEVTEIAERLETAANEASAAPWQLHLAALEGAGLSEHDFLRVLAAVEADKKATKAAVLKIAGAYVGFVDRKLSRDKLLDAIKTRFYSKIYDRDANEMAKRATPW